MQSAGLLATLGVLPNIANAATSFDRRTPLEPFLLTPEPPLSHNGSMDIKVWVRSHMTGGVYSCVECAVAPKVMGPPPHFHKELDELMFVLEGTASVMVEGQEVQVPAGGWHFRPRNLRHTFWNASDQPLRFVDMYFNQPFEEFLERIFHDLTPENGYQPGSDKLRQERDKLDKKFGLVYLPTAFEERQAIVAKYGLR